MALNTLKPLTKMASVPTATVGSPGLDGLTRRDDRTALFTLGLTHMYGQASYYESAAVRDERLRTLAGELAVQDPEWVAGYVRWLRQDAGMRTASIVIAAEYALTGAAGSRQVIGDAIQRADELSEFIGYWRSRSTVIPSRVKRALSDCAQRLYTESGVIKYDSSRSPWRFADVIELCHAAPKDAQQSALYRWLIDARHNRADERTTSLLAELPVLAAYKAAQTIPVDQRRDVFAGMELDGWTWESVAGWLADGKGLTADVWARLVPVMGHTAVVRNIRNIEGAGRLDAATAAAVEAKISDNRAIGRFGMLPHQYWAAWKNSGTMRFGAALEDAFNQSMANVPVFSGRTAVFVDTSASMRAALTDRGSVSRSEVAAVFAAGLKAKNPDTDVYIFAQGSKQVTLPISPLRAVGDMAAMIGQVGHSTAIWEAVRKHVNSGHRRVFIITDDQNNGAGDDRVVGSEIPVITWDLAGAQRGSNSGRPNRFILGGLADGAMKIASVLDAKTRAGWPWESTR